MLPKAILFDLDDTILYSGDAVGEWTAACAEGVPADGYDREAILAAIHEERLWYWSDADRHRLGRLDLPAARRAIVAGGLRRLGLDAPHLVPAIADCYCRLRDEAVAPFDGALETLQELCRRGVKLALITNGAAEVQWDKITSHDLERYFDCIIVEGEFGCGKPEARVYHHALDCLGVTAKDAWMVGDNLEWEVVVPQRLGLYAVWVDARRRGLPPDSGIRPDRIIHSLPELLER